jgi:hypothetical protein
VAHVGSIVGEPQGDAAAIAEHDVDVLRRDTLHLGQEVGIECELQDVLGIGGAFQLGVDDLIGEAAKLRRPADALQEVGVAAPAFT